ncbi:MAG: autotransporter-associated beta strand repeat-containing protein [Akkermansia sp.]|nr:autotransporter-associated beta strand repeat-containing protein [Akkermansia sp.]
MKLHLPVQLFRAVIALMAVAMPFSASAAQKYTVADGQQLTLSGLDELDLDISGYNGSSLSSKVYGGAIYAKGTGSVTLEHYVSVLFNENYAKSSSSLSNSYAYGGAIYSYSGDITLSGNESVTFSGNYASSSSSSASSYGGAIYSSSGDITLSGNESVTFSGNYASSSSSSASSYGGAIYSSSGDITLSGNESVTFSGNWSEASASKYTNSNSGVSTSSGAARGGAICGTTSMSGNDSILFSGNYAYATSVDAKSSSASATGGAISGSTKLVDNTCIIFRGNSVRAEGPGTNTALGGAIYGSSVSIRNNKTVVFEGNYEKTGSSTYTYRLRGLYSTGQVNLSAAEGNSIKFRDSMYAGGNLILNEQHEGIAQTGDIIFSGEYTKKHLSELKSSYTTAELRNSRTSIVGGQTELYDGRLIVREGAILQGSGMTVHTSASGESNTTVLLQNGQINHGDNNITFATGTVMEASGISEMTGNRWTMADGSSITLHASAENTATAVLSYNGHFLMGENLTLNISFDPEDAESGAYKLLNVTTFVDEINWTAENVGVNGLGGFEISFDDLYWDDEILYFNYIADTTGTPGGGSGTGGDNATPYLFVGTWTNESGNGQWDNSSLNWEQNATDYAYTDGTDVVFGDEGAGTVKLVGELAPASVLVNSAEDYTWTEDADLGGGLTGAMTLTKQGEGTLSICTDNSYLGGTSIEGGTLRVQHENALGKGDVALSSGTLEMNGYSVQNNITATGGTLSGAGNYGGRLVITGDLTLQGKVTAAEGIKLSSGSIAGGSIADTKVEAAGDTEVTISSTLTGTSSLSARGNVCVSGANNHTGGSTFNGGSFTLSNATALGAGSVVTMGTNTLHADAEVTLRDAILNSGELTMSGAWDVSALAMQKEDATRIDTKGRKGDSGFARTALYEVQVVLGGRVTAKDCDLTHRELTDDNELILGSNGVAFAGGVVDYSTYYLTGKDSVSVDEAEDVSGGALDNIVMDGGYLEVDGDATVNATGGNIDITEDSTLGGSIKDTDITTAEGDYKSDISADITGDSSLTINGGDITLSGDNNYTGGTEINGGSLVIGDGSSVGTGGITVNGGTLDLNDQEIGNDITLNDGNLTGSDNYNGNLSIGGDNVSVEGGYTLGAGKVLEVATGGTEFGSDLTLAGGTLLFKGAPLTVDGEVSFTEGTTTLVDLRQWEGELTDGLTLAVLGSDVTGWTEDCLELIGMNDMSLGFDAATGTLTLQIEGQQPAAETITWLGAKKTVWQTGKAGWMNATTGHDAVFETGADVIFTQSGKVTIAGAVEPGSVIVAGDKNITFKSDKKNPGRIVGDTTLTKRGKGKLTLNDGNFYSGGTVIEAGTVVAGGASAFGRGDITISGGTLDLKSKAVTNDITLSGAATIKSGKKYGGVLTLEGDLLKGSVLNVAEKAELKSGTVNGTLRGIGTVAVTGDVTLDTKGKITTNSLDVSGTLHVSTKGMSMNSKASAITVEDGAALVSAGALKAYSLEVNGGTVDILTAKASSVTLTRMQMNTGASMNLTGKMTVSGSMQMNGASLVLSGKLTAKDLTLTDSYIKLTSTKVQTITAKNSLTLSGDNTIIFDFDAANGKKYKLFSFKAFTNKGADLYELLGWENNGSYTLTENAKDITLTVLDSLAWESYMDELATGQKAVSAADDAVAEEETAEELLTAPQPVAAAAVDPLLRKAADTLVQSTWGTVNASRAFGDTIAARGAHATLLAEGRGAAWLSTMGGSSRISTDGDRNGADFTLSGAAFGVEGRVTEKSTLGVAIGNSWGKVSTFSAFPVDQDSMHIGIYGNHTLTESLTLSWMATHTRTESELNLLGLPYEWAQDALQLDARLTWATAISDKTTLSVFGGLQYLATDSGESNGLSTGSVQNLRGELGIGASHKCSDSTLVFGELSFVGDMVRNNPTADLGGMRLRGSNPGRAGINLSVGAAHRLSDDWSLNASYSFELMQNVTSHSLNVGASYSF